MENILATLEKGHRPTGLPLDTWSGKIRATPSYSSCRLIIQSLSICLAGFNLDRKCRELVHEFVSKKVLAYFRWGYGYHKDDLPPDIQKALTPKIVDPSRPPFTSIPPLTLLTVLLAQPGLFQGDSGRDQAFYLYYLHEYL